MIRKYHNHTPQTNLRHREEELPKTVTRRQEDKQSKATSSIFPIKMISKLEMTQSTAQQNMRHTQNPRNGSNNKQRINNKSATGGTKMHFTGTKSTQYRLRCC